MSRTSRIWRSLIVAAAVASLLASTTAAAGPKPPKPPKPPMNVPSFSVSLNHDVYSERGLRYVAMTFTSTQAKAAKGLAQVKIPSQFHPPSHGWVYFSWLQSTDPTSLGYVRVEATTCAAATLNSLTVGTFDQLTGTPVTNPTIDVAFNCKPGQQFVIHWFTNLGYAGFDGSNPESWPVEVSTRKSAHAKSTPEAPLEIKVSAVYLDLGPLPFITPPSRLVAVTPVITEPEAPPTQWLLTGDSIYLNQTVRSVVTVDKYYRPDTGEELVAVNPDLGRVDREIQVIDCLDIDVTGTGLPPGVLEPYDFDCDTLHNVVQLDDVPAGAFETQDGGPWTQLTVIAGVLAWNTSFADWQAADSECTYRGGTWVTGAIIGTLWTCSLPYPAPNNDRYNTVAGVLEQAQYCPTGRIKKDPATISLQIIVCIA